jgi:hypothetical protein
MTRTGNIGWLLVAIVSLSSCTDTAETKSMDEDAMSQNEPSQVVGIYSLDHEQSFDEKYGLALTLPMPESQFTDTLNDLGLEFSYQGPDGAGIGRKDYGYNSPRRPRLVSNYDMSRISHSYIIDAGYNSSTRINQLYLALVDTDKQVVYIENQFSEAN